MIKKGIAVFLVHIMLAVGVHPVLAAHFCAGKLHSFRVISGGAEKTCCKGMGMPQQEDKPVQIPHKHSILTSHNRCCNIQKLELSTDDYQAQHFNLSSPLPPFVNICAAFGLQVPAIHDDTAKTGQCFPPGGFSLQNTDLLTRICICRI